MKTDNKATRMKTALLIIDLQNDFTLDDGKVPACTSQIQGVIDKINQIVEKRNKEGELTALITTNWSNPLVKLLTKNSVKPGSFGAEVDARLSKQIKNHFIKTSKDVFTSKDLNTWLKENDVKELIFSGLALEHCIETSVKAAISRDYIVSLLSEGLASYKCDQRKKSILKLEHLGTKLYG